MATAGSAAPLVEAKKAVGGPRRNRDGNGEKTSPLRKEPSMASNLPTRIGAGIILGTFMLTEAPNGADRDFHPPHVPDIHYGIPFNTSGSFVTVSASGGVSRADFGRGPDEPEQWKSTSSPERPQTWISVPGISAASVGYVSGRRGVVVVANTGEPYIGGY
jgi:hypothetical protein